MDDAQRAALRRATLGGLLRKHRTAELGGAAPDVRDVGTGAAVASGDRAYLLVDQPAERALGPALLWAERAGAQHVELFALHAAGDLARRAAYFTDPPLVFEVVGQDLVPAAPGPRRPTQPVAAEAEPFIALLHEAATTVVDDHGVVVGEYEGLEVARIVGVGGEAWIEVGVGEADRQFDEAFHRGKSTVQRIRRVVEVVRPHRTADAELHPLNRLGRERWLRARLLAEPGLVGATNLEPVPPLLPRRGLVADLPAAAAGTTTGGRPLVVVCSVGVDLDLVPEAADLRDRHDPHAHLVIVVPPRDRIPPIERLVARLRHRAELRTLDPPWRAA